MFPLWRDMKKILVLGGDENFKPGQNPTLLYISVLGWCRFLQKLKYILKEIRALLVI